MNIPDKVRMRIVCPDCRNALGVTPNEGLNCCSCGREYAVAADNSLPILFSKHSEFAHHEYSHWERTEPLGTKKRGYRGSRGLPRTNVASIGQRVADRFLDIVKDGMVLNIGSGKKHIRIEENWVSLDIQPHNNCEVVGDAHWLPFLDNSFDAVFSESVFEHLRRPFQAAEEITRVLKPGGTMFCSAPLAYPVHGSPYDFFRYTADGLKSVFSGLRMIDAPPSTGPFVTIAHFSERIADTIFPGKLGFVARFVVAWALHPLKYLDPWLITSDPTSASSFSVLMRKPE